MSTTTTTRNDSINHDLSTQFRALESLLDTLPTLPPSSRLTALDTALHSLSNLSSHLTTVLPHLPAYDQRQHTAHLTTLTTRLTTLRAQLAPRPKFSFKSRKTASTSPTIGGDITPVNTPAPLSHTASTQGSNITITGRKGELIRIAAATPGASLLLDDIDGCVIVLEGAAQASFSSAAAKGVRGSVIVLGEALDGPMHITGLERSVLVLRCRQLRMHEARESEVYLWCKSSPIVEDCSGVRFAPYGEAEGNMWEDVKDFKWLRGDEPSPNWSLVPVEERKKELSEGKIEGEDVEEILSRVLRR